MHSCRWYDLPERAQKRVDAALAVLSACRGAQCANPLPTIHPSGEVHTLAQVRARGRWEPQLCRAKARIPAKWVIVW